MSQTLFLPAELTICHLAELRADWLAAMEGDVSDGPFEVGADRVDDIDAAGIQLVLSLSHALVRDGRALKLVEPSGALRAACMALGAGFLVAQAASTTVPA